MSEYELLIEQLKSQERLLNLLMNLGIDSASTKLYGVSIQLVIEELRHSPAFFFDAAGKPDSLIMSSNDYDALHDALVAGDPKLGKKDK
jgi:hypothetical protein